MEHKEFYELDHPILNEIKSYFPNLRSEAIAAYKNDFFVEWVSKQIYDKGWTALGFRYENTTFENDFLKDLLPCTYNIFKKFDPYLYSIAYSNFDPQTVIKPHFDRLRPHNIIRCHLGISVPDGDCRLKVNKIEKAWNEGEFLFFDDSFEHEAWNFTNENRIVLLMDFHKDKIVK